VGGQQRLLLDGDLVAEARVDQHDGVAQAGLFGALDELQLRALHHDGIPQDGHCRGAQRLEQSHKLVFYVRTTDRRVFSQTEDLCDLQRATEGIIMWIDINYLYLLMLIF